MGRIIFGIKLMTDNRRTVTINNSSSKQQFLFAKSNRFSVGKADTKAFAYDLQPYFGKQTGSGAGRGFTSS